MAWGLPPSYRESKVFSAFSHEKLIEMTENALNELDYTIQQKSPYTLHAYKKLRVTFFSFFNFTRPRLDVSIMADEDGKLTVEIQYNHANGYVSTFNDLGKSKKHVKQILEKVMY